MTIHTTPDNRKRMAQAISELLGEPAVYMRIPTYAYQIGNVTVNRDGSTSCEDADTLERIMPMLIENGYLAPDTDNMVTVIEEQIQEPEEKPERDTVSATAEQIQEPAGEREKMDITMPVKGITVPQLRNLMFALYSKQNLLNKAQTSCASTSASSTG